MTIPETMPMDEPKDISLHDNRLVCYEVHCERREIRFHTEYGDLGPTVPIEHTDVIFQGVECYFFQHDSKPGTIIFDIEEVPAKYVYDTNVELIQAGIRNGWPGTWAATYRSAEDHFIRNGIRGFILSSSCGMDGWVLATEMTKILLPTKSE